ncbi:hypothetical protein E7Z59_10780 [Robertkochia marina]|uniref:Urease accessory protein UreH-like transmembrane domain-containing protein n=1 Tax=Robertkochia marina TaxID=1227945 RepID=A0A4S3LXM6_9FLAO|nr:sulfite exporter TauE/SafE family protein [Robertkochia marina]THD66292.1 hypothetical protein E7Z59_10780 [Robertkochia marina]TRZ41213.1 hypothetical protein D3A96_13655 [Robertkochia marina]
MNISYAIITGCLAAAAHVFSGPDHLAAVAPLAVGGSAKSWQIGLFWGLGHLAGMLLVGVLFTLLQDFPPLEVISSYSEALVGFVLIGIGIWALIKAFAPNAGTVAHRPHTHGNKDHLASFSIGSLHGLAGVAHFILFLPVLGFESRSESVFYIIGFAIGTVAAMVIFTFALGKISSFPSSANKKNFMKSLRIISGIAAIAIGIYWILIN